MFGTSAGSASFAIKDKKSEDFIFWLMGHYKISDGGDIIIERIDYVEQNLGIPLQEGDSFVLKKIGEEVT